jgi:Cu/Ag efflux pump CusA
LARVVVGGMISSAVVILVVLPAIYLFVHQWLHQRQLEGEFDHPGHADVVG